MKSREHIRPRANSAKSLRARVRAVSRPLPFWKFGNPVILDNKISPPASPADFWNDSWPTHWANWIFLPLALAGAAICLQEKIRLGRPAKWLWLLPLLWFGWQFFSATKTVDADLTATTLWQFSGCVAVLFSGRISASEMNARSTSCWSGFWPRSPFAWCAPLTSGFLNFPKITRCSSKANVTAGQIFHRNCFWK